MADREYVGCSHVHTTFSDGSTPAAEVVEIAAKGGLDFLAISDHNSDGTRQAGLTGWHGRLLAMSAPEVGRRGQPHFVAFCPPDLADILKVEGSEALELADRQGAINFIAHPHPARIAMYPSTFVGWADYSSRGFRGLELWSYMHDVCHHVVPWRLPWFWSAHESLVRGPRPETLRLWDDLCRTRRVAAIAGLDNHATRLPIVGETLPHGELFRVLRTHVVCPPLPEDGAQAERAFARAIGEGKAFIAMDSLADATGFRLRAVGPGPTLGFGEEAAYCPGWRLVATSPVVADLTALRDGRPVASEDACQGLELPVDAPGVYRVEGRIKGKPWVFTNPIYLRETPEHG